MGWAHRQARRGGQVFPVDAGEAMRLTSDNACLTAVEGVPKAFRRRLTAQEALDFAKGLPAVLRARFVADGRIAPAPARARHGEPGPRGSAPPWPAHRLRGDMMPISVGKSGPRP